MIKRRTSRARKLGAYVVPTIGETVDCNTKEENSSILNNDEKKENKKHRKSNEPTKKNQVQDPIQGK